MKKYIKPYIEEEKLEIEDIIAISVFESDENGKYVKTKEAANPFDVFKK